MRRDGGMVTEEQWTDFVEETVSPEFPAGSTVMRADGRYLDAAGRLHVEPSRVLVLFYSADAAAAVDASIGRITRRYLASFDQESVLRSDADARVTFVGLDAPAPSSR
jgi:hypothetical protein